MATTSTTSPPRKYLISSCTVHDSDALAVNNLSAFWADPNYGLDWPGRTFEYHLIQMAKRFPDNLLSDRETKRHLKAVDPDTGRVVGYIRWILPDGCDMTTWSEAVTPAVGEDDAEFYRRLKALADWDAGSGSTATDAAMDGEAAATDGATKTDGEAKATNEATATQEGRRQVQKVQDEILSRKKFLRLDYLAVHPDHQRKGIGAQLVAAGLEEAKKIGIDVYVLAFLPGVELYRRFGFQLETELWEGNADKTGKEYRGFMTLAVNA